MNHLRRWVRFILLPGFALSVANGVCRPDNDRVLLDRVTDHCDIVETGNNSWRFKHRSRRASRLSHPLVESMFGAD